jgi:UDP-glucose-4-epimerase GalE
MHFAAHSIVAESVADPRKYFDNNVCAGLTLLDSVVAAGVRHFIFSSSCAVYGVPSQVPIRETTPRQPLSPYGLSKKFFEDTLQAYAAAYGVRYVSLRYFNAAGADESGEIGELHDPEPHLIPSILQVVEGIQDEMTIYGSDYPTPDGTCIRDYIHVNDLAQGHVRALQYLVDGRESTALNLGTGYGKSILEIVAAVEEVTGCAVRKRLCARRPGDPPILVADPGRAQQLLDWNATRDLKDIIFTAWKWMQRIRQSSLVY